MTSLLVIVLTIFITEHAYFDAKFHFSICTDEFPEEMQSALHLDGSGRIYEDFYRYVFFYLLCLVWSLKALDTIGNY